MTGFRVGVDIGGTFTDIVLINAEGRLVTKKISSSVSNYATAIVDGLAELGGYLTIADLANHSPRWVDPLSVDYKGYTLYELPPAGQGIAALQMLKMLEGYDFGSIEHNSAEYLHTLIEAKKLAHADLARYVADPDHMDVQPEALLDPGYLAGRATLIDPAAAADRPDPGRMVTDSETIYLTVADRHGNMISFINSIYGYFGSRVVVPLSSP